MARNELLEIGKKRVMEVLSNVKTYIDKVKEEQGRNQAVLSEVRTLLAPAAPILLFPVVSDRISEKGTKGANKGFTTKDGTLRFYFEETRIMYVLDKEKNRRVRMNERQGLKCVLKNWIIYVLTYVTDKNAAIEQVDVEEDEDEMPSVNSAAIDFVNSIVANLPHDKRNTRKIDEVSDLVGWRGASHHRIFHLQLISL